MKGNLGHVIVTLLEPLALKPTDIVHEGWLETLEKFNPAIEKARQERAELKKFGLRAPSHSHVADSMCDALRHLEACLGAYRDEMHELMMRVVNL